jgi:phage terminase large subunit
MPDVCIPRKFQPLFKPKRYKAFFGGRGSAKSWSIAQALLIKGYDDPLRSLCAREIQKSIKDSVKKLLDDTIDRMGLRWFYTSTDTEIRGLNGTLFIFSGLRSNPDSVRSMEGIDIAWVEEAQKLSLQGWEILDPTVRKDGSEIWLSWNPRYDKDPVQKLFIGSGDEPPLIDAEEAVVVEVNWRDNPWFSATNRKSMERDRRRDPDKYRHVWEGALVTHSSATVFRRWSVEEFTAPEGVVYYYGADWGFRDQTALIRCFAMDRGGRATLFVDYEAYKAECQISAIPALFETVPESRGLGWKIISDNNRPDLISHMRGLKFNCVAAKKGRESEPEGIAFLRDYDIVVHPRCLHTQYELTNFSYKVDPQTGDVLDKLDPDNADHLISALRYALETIRRRGGFYVAKLPKDEIVDEEGEEG